MGRATPQTMKRLTRIRLVNWHYFANETIEVNGSCLISGENASGKSTILDAVQMILTTNTRRFNPAANERSKRDLRGYVRCKTGEEGHTYVRKGSVISYVALEFYEEGRDRFFVLGAKFDSPDEESDIRKIWFCEEGSLDALSFVVENRPATDEQFRNNGRKVNPIRSMREARDRFKRRLGNLDETFFDLIPKSLAFKPMDNVKRFITQFILPERRIEVDVLRENIRRLREMQLLIEEVKRQIAHLERILQTHDQVVETGRDILVIDILLRIAESEGRKTRIEGNRQGLERKRQELQSRRAEAERTAEELESERASLQAIRTDMSRHACSQLIEKLEQDLQSLEKDRRSEASRAELLRAQLRNLAEAMGCVPDLPEGVTQSAVLAMGRPDLPQEARDGLFVALRDRFRRRIGALNGERAEQRRQAEELGRRLSDLRERIERLRRNQITYPRNAIALRDAVKAEFDRRSLDADVRVFADLLEIADPKWQNAAEGYLGARRFDLLVDPKRYDVAAEVYDRLKPRIEGVALVNTKELDTVDDPPKRSLASAVTSEDRMARAYADCLMGRVILCGKASELARHEAAITADCMLYQDKGLRRIPAEDYRVPYIGKRAIQRQLEIAETEFRETKERLDAAQAAVRDLDGALARLDACNFGLVELSLSAPAALAGVEERIRQTTLELKDARNDPNIITLQFKKEACRERVAELSRTSRELEAAVINLERDIADLDRQNGALREEVSEIERSIDVLSGGDSQAILAARQKYRESSRTREAGTIHDNYVRRRAALDNRRRSHRDRLIQLQTSYKEGELGTGEETVPAYAEEHRTLSRHNLTEYEEKLRQAKSDCELEFRENFLARMRENIESAQDIFKDLNRALRNIYYGDDSYRFHCSAHRMKRGLYEMITSEVNVGGFTLFSSEFEERYHNEMEELFSRLTESDEHGDRILSEYTDYREYLDYDIEIVSRDGKSQYVSKIYGEKSGGETQIPYYVAIAASFAQIYSVGETVRIVMLDEAFDKMDDDRIASMMRFLRSQNFQVILATPPAKIEVIAEYVETVLVTYREGYASYVEAYDL